MTVESPPAKGNNKSLRSYAVRSTKISKHQQLLLESRWKIFGINPPDKGPLNLKTVFQRENARVLEVGFGNGDTIANMAITHPEIDFIGIEVYQKGISQCLEKVSVAAISNIRLIQGDALEVMAHWFPDNSFERIHVFFPDPWPKSRHWKRRLVRAEFITSAKRLLRPNGILQIATDWQDYANHVIKLLKSDGDFLPVDSHQSAVAGSSINRSLNRPITKYETRGEHLGHRIHDLLYQLPR